jgi:hypothetical protein
MRLRLTANSVADLRGHDATDGAARRPQADPVVAVLRQRTADLGDFYERVAGEVGPPRGDLPAPVVVPDLRGLDGADGLDVLEVLGATGAPGGPDGAGNSSSAPFDPRVLWVREHLHHLREHAPAITVPAEHVAELRRVPWWR